MAIISFSGKSATTSINRGALHGPRRIPRVDGCRNLLVWHDKSGVGSLDRAFAAESKIQVGVN